MKPARREILKAGGALIVGCVNGFPAPPVPNDQVDSWVAIAADGFVTAYTGKCDFGQGFRTVQQQLVAEELGVRMDRIRMVVCDTDQCPNQGTSSGSQGHPTQFGPRGLRAALATARRALLQMAADRLSVPVDQLIIDNGVIYSAGRAKSIAYDKLIGGRKINLPVDARAVPKHPSTYTVLGQSVPRLDIPPKVTGEFEFVHNVRIPGMLHAKVVRPPTVGGKVISVDEASVRALPGNVRVVVRKDFVAVAADTQWHAIRAASTLKVNWSPGDTLPSQATLYDAMREMPARSGFTVAAANVDDRMRNAARTFSATYRHPFQMHGSMGTSCAVADVRGTGPQASATIWSASQGIYAQRDSLAIVLNIPKENIHSIFVEGAGCYGLNGADSVAYDAAVVSQAIGRPVRLQYSRKDEMTAGESFGPAYVIDLKAGIDAAGQIEAWDFESWSLNKGSRPSATSPGNVIAGGLLGYPAPAVRPTSQPSMPSSFNNNGNSASPYGTGCVGDTCRGTGKVRSERVLTHTVPSPFYTGPLRSPNRLQNTFANESFIDEIAAALTVDPVAYRLRHLADPRLIDVLNATARALNWDTRPSPKPGNPRTGAVTGRGIAIVFYEGSNGYGGLAAEVSVDQKTGKIVVTRMAAANDSGPVSNPDGLRSQMEGGALQGMSRALLEEVRWDNHTILSTDWSRFPVVRFGDPLPKVESVLLHRPDMPHMGAGETIITLSAAAIANAIFDATGARIREVPFTPARVLAALAARK